MHHVCCSARRGGATGFSRHLKQVVICTIAMTLFSSMVLADTAITLIVKDEKTGSPITDFKFTINVNNVGDPFSNDPAENPSTWFEPSYSPVAAAGDGSNPTATLPDGSYLVSVLAGGYKMGGKHFDLPGPDTVVVELIKHPLPLSKMLVLAFEDNHPTNSEADEPAERGLEGFRVVISDAIGELMADYWGNPLGTTYQKDEQGQYILDQDGVPIVDAMGAGIFTGSDGRVTVDNIAPGKYAVEIIPPDDDPGWIQTSTIEGKHEVDCWLIEGNDGYSPEGAVEGPFAPMAFYGFVKEMSFPPGAGTGVIDGKVVNEVGESVIYGPPQPGGPVYRPYIALNNLSGDDEMVYLGRGNPDGTFSITGVPDGTYQLAIFDKALDYIISFRTAIVENGQPVHFGTILVPRWFGWIKGCVYEDTNGNGSYDPGEGIPGVGVGTRFKDGSLQYGTVTDMSGYYVLEEVFPGGKFTVLECGFTRFEHTSAIVHYPDGTRERYDTGTGALLLANLTFAGLTNRVDFEKKPYAPGQNGGISGAVFNDSMRAVWDPRYSGQEDFEPGIPGVTVNLYAEDGVTLLNSVETDGWFHPTGCPIYDNLGNLVGVDPICKEGLNTGNQVHEGLFDGGYAFSTYIDPQSGEEIPLTPGTYIVEVVPPTGYKVSDWNSFNAGDGDVFYPAIPPPPLVGPPVLVTDPESPFYGEDENGNPNVWKPSPSRKLVRLFDQQNAAADFFLYTEAPVAARLWGLLTDDLNVETYAQRKYFGDKRGLAYIPIGIRDYKGKLIMMTYTDINGEFETLLPSTYTSNVPSASGVAPAMYFVVGNDPGDPGNPDPFYNPDYQTLPLAFDFWVGKTTWADVAIMPITTLVDINAQRPECLIPADLPEIASVSAPYVTEAERDFTISGLNFGVDQGMGAVTVGGAPVIVTSWSDTSISATVPAGFQTGPGQLMVTNSLGKASSQGLTFHVIGGSYTPAVVTVSQGESIQAAIDAAAPDSLVVVGPGTYFQNLIVYKPVKLQGVGAAATTLDGRFFNNTADQWRALLASTGYIGNQQIASGSAITVVAPSANTYGPGSSLLVDGLTISGCRGNGAIYVNTYGRNVEIGNNLIMNNAGGFGGAITIGLPFVSDNETEGARIHHNYILHNGGIRLAGGIGIYTGSDGYEVDHNVICGNYSAEYGGGLSHYGLSPGGRIHHNQVTLNSAFDEGGGILVGGELAALPELLSAGSGSVDIYNNVVRGNHSNDDGGGIRLLAVGQFPMSIVNNVIVNNVATDFGGGIALDDASDVAIINNTIAKNISTATAEDSDRLPHSAGLASEGHSAAFMATLPPGSPDFSDPVLVNNIFWDNRAYHFDPEAPNNEIPGAYGALVFDGVIDLEVFGTPTPEYFSPHYCTLTEVDPNHAYAADNLFGDPGFELPYDLALTAVSFAGDPAFITVRIILDPTTLGGDYHLAPTSMAIDAGTASGAPSTDVEDAARPADGDLSGTAQHDVGAYEFLPAVQQMRLRQAAEEAADGTSVVLNGIVVTAVFPEIHAYYVEQPDRAAGIRVDASTQPAEGQVGSVTGAMATVGGERRIVATDFTPAGETMQLGPVGINLRGLGGGPAGLIPGITGAVGLNNVGLLVAVTGRVGPVGDGYFMLDDGSAVRVKVAVPPGVDTSGLANAYVRVTGASSVEQDDASLHRLVRARGQADIAVLAGP